MISVKVIKDSINTKGVRLTTVEAHYPRIILPEVLTHREFSRNTSSTRARPVGKVVDEVLDDPFTPVFWGKNQSGMQSYEELEPDKIAEIQAILREGLNYVANMTKRLTELGLHKQYSGRYIEPWSYTTQLISSTSFQNFLFLRNHHAAQPEIQELAQKLEKALSGSTPIRLSPGQWHLPLLDDYYDLRQEMYKAGLIDEEIFSNIKKISVGRCARVSYLTHGGVRDWAKDIELYNKLVEGFYTNNPMHLSPFEHVAMATDDIKSYGNFRGGWKQLRQFVEVEGP